MSRSEMAICNLAFGYGLTGDGLKMKAQYQRAKSASPGARRSRSDSPSARAQRCRYSMSSEDLWTLSTPSMSFQCRSETPPP